MTSPFGEWIPERLLIHDDKVDEKRDLHWNFREYGTAKFWGKEKYASTNARIARFYKNEALRGDLRGLLEE